MTVPNGVHAERIYTVGHSNRSASELVDVLSAGGIRILVDVRAHPGSRRFPHFSGEALRRTLDAAGIRYHWGGRHLGGMRSPRADSPHHALTDAFRGYADHMAAPEFSRAVDLLLDLGAREPLAIMCAERLPEQCHRSLIADFLVAKLRVQVLHLAAPGDGREHRLRPELDPDQLEAGRLVYACYAQRSLDLTDE